MSTDSLETAIVAGDLRDREANAGLPGELPAWVPAKAIEELPVALCITDLEANILYANRAFTDVTGYGVNEVLGENTSLLSHQCTPPRVYEQMWERLAQRKPWSGLLVNRRKYGAVYVAELTVTPLLDPRGKPACFVGLHRDVTSVHRLEQQVLNQKTLIESMVDAAPAVIALLNEQGQVILDNHAYKKLATDMQGRQPAVELMRTLRESMGDSFTQGYRVGKGFQDREVNFEPGGGQSTRWFSCSGTWFREQDDRADAFFQPVRQTYLLLMANEITNLKKQQEAVKMNAMRALLAEQERVRSMRETLEAAIFQMQGPLNLISAANDMLQRRGAAPELDALRSVLRQALVTGRQALAKLQNSVPAVPPEAVASVNINQLLREVLTLCTNRMLASGVVVEWKPEPVLPAVPGREGRLRGLFKQLVDNALDAMESHRTGPRDLHIVTGRTPDDKVMVTIEDTGPGIPRELQIKVFEPFYTSKIAADRIGMGLTLAQEVVNEHRGIIIIDPDYTGGCRFRVLLPLQHDLDLYEQ